MARPPLILVTPDIEKNGVEMGDLSISLAVRYERAIIQAGGLPMAMPATVSRQMVAQCVNRVDGILMTGGDDVDPRLYGEDLPARLQDKVAVTADGGARDLRELMLVDEVFRQRKPLLAICRGHQMLNVALGGTLVADIPSQVPGAINHRQMDRKNVVVHEAQLTRGSLLAKITGQDRLGVNSTHHQAVRRVATPLKPSAVSGDGVIEALELKPEAAHWLPFLLSVQFHPERLVSRHPEHRAIFQAFTRACSSN
jgi:putative glutamine amidotransferase